MNTLRLAAGAIAALILATSVTAAPALAGEWRPGPYGPYYQRGDRWSPGAAAAVGAIGGLALGAAIASSAPRPAPVYTAPPVVVEETPEERCWTERRQVWVPGWGWEVRRRSVCE